MAVLGVLLGITMCAVAWAINESREHRKLIIDIQNAVVAVESRVAFLEKRKALLAEAVATQPKPAGVGAVHSRVRTWNEDAPPVEKAKS